MHSSDFKGKNKMIALDLDAELFFPLEIIFEILSWLTVASLLRCKCVCKRWNEIIQHPKFIKMHGKRGELSFYYTSKDGTAETFTILDSRHGLLLEQSKISGGIYRVRNPATKQILALPDPQEALRFMRIFFLPFTNSYKLVYIYYSKDNIGKCGCKVLSLGGSDLSWRDLEDPYLHELDRRRYRIFFSMEGVFLYCIWISIDGSNDSQILCLDVKTEIFTSSPLSAPKSFFLNQEKVWSIKWNKKVALGSIVEEELHVWVLENLIHPKLADEKIIIPLTFLKENPDMKETLAPAFASTKKILFTGDVQEIVYYIKSKQILKSQSAPPGKIIMCDGAPSLVTLKRMQTENKENTDAVVESSDKVTWAR